MASSILNCFTTCHSIDDDVTTYPVYLCGKCCQVLCEKCWKIHMVESEFQVSGRRSKGRSENNESTFDTSEDLHERVQDMSLSPDVSTNPGTSKAVNVYEKATLKSELNVSIDSDDGPCEVRGIVLIEDRIIVCDHANSKLKVFDSCHKFLYEHVCDNKPYDIDNLDDATVVVSSSGSTIRRLSVRRDSMTELLKINTGLSCYGLCCFDGRIYCFLRSRANNSQIHVYTPDGKLKRRFEFLSDGKMECNGLRYIRINPQTGTLYVTDWNRGCVAQSARGHVFAAMQTPLLGNPEGIAVDDFGQIHICGRRLNTVIQMSADGQEDADILSIIFRRSKYMKVQGNSMFLISRNSDTVSVYDLS